MSNKQQYSGSSVSDTSRRRSNFWAGSRVNEIISGDFDGIRTFHDFASGGKITVPTTEAALVGLGVNGFGSSGSTISYDQVKNGGGALILAETTASEGVILRDAVAPFQISSGVGSLWFEARVKPLLIATTEMAFVAGLMDTTAASATVPLTMSTGAIADVNFVGFHKPVANTTALDTSYKADGVTAVEVNSDVGTLAAATWIKLGMKFDTVSNVLSFYINGVKQASTKTIPNAKGTDFPADVALGWVIGMCVGAGASDNELHVDWVEVVQHLQ